MVLIKALPGGIHCLEDGNERWRLPWESVRRILAYAEDHFTMDSICLRVETDLGNYRLPEEVANFDAFCGTLGNYLDLTEPFWKDHFLKEPFSTRQILLYERGP